MTQEPEVQKRPNPANARRAQLFDPAEALNLATGEVLEPPSRGGFGWGDLELAQLWAGCFDLTLPS